MSLFGGKLHVWTATESEITLAETTLAQAGIAVSAQTRILPSLEDVFINQVAAQQGTTAGTA